MNDKRLLEVCFSLAQDLMWSHDTAPLEKLPEHIAELKEMTDTFMLIANEHFYLVEQLEDSEEILFGAIRYLNAQAIPPLRGNYTWFAESLATLLEICNPKSIVAAKDIPFLLSMQKGILKHIQYALYKKDYEEEEE